MAFVKHDDRSAESETIQSLVLSPLTSVSYVNDINLLDNVRRITRVPIDKNDREPARFADWEGTFHPFGPALFVPDARVNFLSLAVVLQYCPVVYESTAAETSFRIQIKGGQIARFKQISPRNYVYIFQVAGPKEGSKLLEPQYAVYPPSVSSRHLSQVRQMMDLLRVHLSLPPRLGNDAIKSAMYSYAWEAFCYIAGVMRKFGLLS